MAETRQRLPQPGQPSELEKRFQEGIKEAEDFAARFLAEHGEAGNAEYFGQPIKHVCVAVLSILILYDCWNIRDSHNQDMYARNIMQYNEVVVQFFDFRFGSTQFATLLAGAQAKLLRYAPGDLAGGLTAGFNGEQCPGCAGIVRDYCDACAFGRTRHILDAGAHSLCLCERCYALLLQVREEMRPKASTCESTSYSGRYTTTWPGSAALAHGDDSVYATC